MPPKGTEQKEKLSYCETARQFEISGRKRVAAWEQICLTIFFCLLWQLLWRTASAAPTSTCDAKPSGPICWLRFSGFGWRMPAPKIAGPGFGKRAATAEKAQVWMKPTDKYGSAKEAIMAIYHENRVRNGYRRITMAIRGLNRPLNHKTVRRLMKELGRGCHVRMKKYRSYKVEVGKIAQKLLNRDFHTDSPNRKWVTDVTGIGLFGKKCICPRFSICTAIWSSEQSQSVPC